MSSGERDLPEGRTSPDADEADRVGGGRSVTSLIRLVLKVVAVAATLAAVVVLLYLLLVIVWMFVTNPFA